MKNMRKYLFVFVFIAMIGFSYGMDNGYDGTDMGTLTVRVFLPLYCLCKTFDSVLQY